MPNPHFDESLVAIIDERHLAYQAIEKRLGDILVSGHWVKSSYMSALLERERRFPTALDMHGPSIAIPHCEPECVRRDALCVGVLKHPVSWRCMDDFSRRCDVSLVFMLALTEAHAHLEMLREVIELAQDRDLVEHLIACDRSKHAYGLLNERFSCRLP